MEGIGCFLRGKAAALGIPPQEEPNFMSYAAGDSSLSSSDGATGPETTRSPSGDHPTTPSLLASAENPTSPYMPTDTEDTDRIMEDLQAPEDLETSGPDVQDDDMLDIGEVFDEPTVKQPKQPKAETPVTFVDHTTGMDVGTPMDLDEHLKGVPASAPQEKKSYQDLMEEELGIKMKDFSGNFARQYAMAIVTTHPEKGEKPEQWIGTLEDNGQVNRLLHAYSNLVRTRTPRC